jgi:hypothetical protein
LNGYYQMTGARNMLRRSHCVLALLLIVTLVAGCGFNPQEGEPCEPEPPGKEPESPPPV